MDIEIESITPVEYTGGELETGTWYRIDLDDTVCADGSIGNTYVKKGSIDNLVVFFMGGGVSWCQESAKYPFTIENIGMEVPSFYFDKMDYLTECGIFLYTAVPGIFAVCKENLFADWNMVVVNYATADFHVGDNDYPYTDMNGEQKILHHRGYGHSMECLKRAKEFFPQAGKLLICGCSGGAFAVPALASDIMDLYVDCRDVTVYSDSAVILMDSWRDAAANVWKCPDRIAESIQTDNIVADWYRQLFKNKGNSIKYLYSNSIRDQAFSTYINYFNTGRFSPTEEACAQFTIVLKEHIAELKRINPGFGIYLNEFPCVQEDVIGTEHCVLNSEVFYRKSDGGLSTMEWLMDAVNGKVYDVGMRLLGEKL